jgi:hypothetical protein
MRISTLKKLPTSAELISVLKQELPQNYSYKLFGLGKEKTVLVTKSSSVGAQISIHDNEITIQGTPPPPVAYFVSFLGWTEFAALLLFFVGWSTRSKLVELEKELAIFLKNKYN